MSQVASTRVSHGHADGRAGPITQPRITAEVRRGRLRIKPCKEKSEDMDSVKVGDRLSYSLRFVSVRKTVHARQHREQQRPGAGDGQRRGAANSTARTRPNQPAVTPDSN